MIATEIEEGIQVTNLLNVVFLTHIFLDLAVNVCSHKYTKYRQEYWHINNSLIINNAEFGQGFGKFSTVKTLYLLQYHIRKQTDVKIVTHTSNIYIKNQRDATWQYVY